MNTYEILKELSRERKISIRQLEMKFGYSNGYLSKWKTNTPNSDELLKLANYFDVSVDYLLGRESSEKKKDSYVQYFKMKTDGLTDEQTETLKEEWLDYLDIRSERMKKRNAERNHK